MTDEMQPWPTLTDFLDAGGDLAVGWAGTSRGMLIEELYTEASILPPVAREREIWVQMQWAKESFEHALPRHAEAFQYTEAKHFELCRRHAWYAEILADSHLMDRVVGLLTPEERAKGERDADLFRRPRPLRVAMPEGSYWHCYSCGQTFDPDTTEAIIVGIHPDEDEADRRTSYEIEYCRDCIALALAAFDAGRVS
jgi:hypothetical protein